MRFIGKLMGIIAGLILLILVVLYFLLQTQWAAGRISQWVSTHTRYHLAFTQIRHSWSSPTHIRAEGLSFGLNGQPVIVDVNEADIGLRLGQVRTPFYASSLSLRHGSLILNNTPESLSLRADYLRLEDMTVTHESSTLSVTIRHTDAVVTPWLPEANSPLGQQTTFDMRAETLALNDVQARHVVLQGQLNQGALNLTTISADMARGSLTASARRDAKGNWSVDEARLSHIGLQTSQDFSDFIRPFFSTTTLNIHHLDVIKARLEGPGWAMSDLDLGLRNIVLSPNGWQSDNGQFSLNASEIILGSLHLQDTSVNATLTPQGASLQQFSAHWEKGLIRTNGQWLRKERRLQLNTLSLSGLEYTLPENWKALWQQALPDGLNEILITQLTLSNSLIIDINPAWPFQITAFNVSGEHLSLARNHQWGIWSGSLSAHAADATFNRIDISRPAVSLNADASRIAITNFSTLLGKGRLNATATISQSPTRTVSVEMQGQAVALNVLRPWGWPSPALDGEGNFTLSLSSSLQTNGDFTSGIHGTMNAESTGGRSVVQNVVNGHPVSP